MTDASGSGSQAGDHPAQRARSTWKLTLIFLLIIALAAAAIGRQSGLLKSRNHIALITSTEDVYWDRLFLGAKAGAEYFDVEIDLIKCKSDEKVQSQMIRDLLNKGLDGLVVSPASPDAQSDLLREVSEKIGLVTVDSDSPRSNRIAFIGTNNYMAGKQCAELVQDALPEGGEIILCVGSVDNDNGRSRREGILDTLLNRARDPQRASDPLGAPISAGKYTILKTLIDGGEPDKAKSLAIEAINAHPNLKCMVGMWSYNTPALLDALKQTGKLGQIRLVGFDDLEPTLAGVEAGHVFATLVQDQYNMGFDSVMTLCAAIKRSDILAIQPRTAYLTCTPLLNAEDIKLFRATRDGTEVQ